MANLDENLKNLMALYKIVNPKDLAGSYQIEKFTNSKSVDTNFLGQILNIFVNTSDSSGSGLLLYDEIKEALKDIISKSDSDTSEQIKEYINLHDDVSMDEILGSQKIVDPKVAKLRVISLKSPYLGISLRDVNKAGVFLNAVPSLELSRCQPLLDVKFELEFRGENSNDPTFAAKLSSRSTTLLRYLNGANEYGSADLLMAKGSLKKRDLSYRSTKKSEQDVWKNSTSITSGMELFTSPQTLISPYNTLGNRTIIDRFAGLMTIKDFEITNTPMGGTYMHKTGKLNLVVHDRSRLHEVAELIKPDAYSRTTVSISYGWSHPDKSGNSPMADLINQMVVHDEKYNIVNSSFSFTGGTSVNITLSLAMKGSNELNVIRIAEGPEFLEAERRLAEISEIIADYRNRIPGLTPPEYTTKEVKVFQLINSAANNGELIENYASKQALQELRALITTLKNPKKGNTNSDTAKSLDDLVKKLGEFIELKEKNNKALNVDPKNTNKNPRPLIDHVLGKKFNDMIGKMPDKTQVFVPDPFYDVKVKNEPNVDDGKKTYHNSAYYSSIWEQSVKQKGKKYSPLTHVSLAKILLFYIGVPFQSLGQFDEIQFVYYPINTSAGLAGGTCLSSFPIEIAYLLDVLADHAKRKGSANLTISEFVSVLLSSTIQDVRNPAYGFSKIFVDRKPGDIGTEPEINKNTKSDKLDGSFRKPVVQIQVETRSGRPLKDGETRESKDARIVRIHVYDKLSSAYEPTLKLLQAQKGLAEYEPYSKASFQVKLNDIANLIGIKHSDFKDGVFTNQESLRKMITQTTPVLTYGSNNSGIIAASLQTMQNSDLATVNMQRAMGPQLNSEPNNGSISALPLRVQPAQLDLTLIGCPLLAGTQQYFIDFGTGTTLDDLYVLTHLSHRISAGKFESTAKLIPMNAYGTYDSIASQIRKLKVEIEKLAKSK